MEALFPLKISIRDKLIFEANLIFLLSSEEKITEKNIEIPNKIYYLGEIEKSGKKKFNLLYNS